MARLDLRPARLDVPVAVGDDVVFSAAVTGYDLTGATCTASIVTVAGAAAAHSFTVAVDEATNAVTLSLTDSQTTALETGVYRWSLVSTVGSDTRTLVAGNLTITSNPKGAA